jgi:hypothetical protein
MAIGEIELRARARRAWVRSALCCATSLLTVGACDGAPTGSAELVNLAAVLPAEAPYITGTIGSVDLTAGTRLLVERTPASRETGALVEIGPNLPVYWRSGRRASSQELQVGRVITVWVSGAELRSLPPQVGASTIVIER